MRLGYNTNGLAHHGLSDAIDLLGDLGYRSVAITVDHGALDPFDGRLPLQLEQIRRQLQRLGMQSVIETGARFLLDPRSKHEPTLVTSDPAARTRRVEFLCRAIDIASALESDCVSLWSGTVHDRAPEQAAWERLLAGLRAVMEYAERRGVVLGFEPEPGMFVDTMHRFEQLVHRLGSPQLMLTLDIGHLHCLGETPLDDVIRRWRARLVNVHLEDMKQGEHRHLMFGEGEIEFPPVLRALRQTGYGGGLHVELSRHSHDGPRSARRAMEFLSPLMDG